MTSLNVPRKTSFTLDCLQGAVGIGNTVFFGIVSYKITKEHFHLVKKTTNCCKIIRGSSKMVAVGLGSLMLACAGIEITGEAIKNIRNKLSE